MPTTQPNSPAGPPRWLLVVASLLIGYHLLAVTLTVLAAPSGPWPSPEGPLKWSPPQFAVSLNQGLTADYLRTFKLGHNAHFDSNQPGMIDVFLEVHLKDNAGKEIKTVRLPDPEANSWLRFQQSLLARPMTMDMPLPPPSSEVIAAPHKANPTMPAWEMVSSEIPGIRKLKLVEMDVNTINDKQREGRMSQRPSDWTLLLVHSYARHLCRVHGAAKAEIIRHSHEPIPPGVLSNDFRPEENTDAFGELVSNFGELAR
jgi:hypothetical protein